MLVIFICSFAFKKTDVLTSNLCFARPGGTSPQHLVPVFCLAYKFPLKQPAMLSCKPCVFGPAWRAYLGPGVLLAEQVCVEVGHLPVPLVGEAPHELPIAHVMELPPVLLRFTALLEPLDSL